MGKMEHYKRISSVKTRSNIQRSDLAKTPMSPIDAKLHINSDNILLKLIKFNQALMPRIYHSRFNCFFQNISDAFMCPQTTS